MIVPLVELELQEVEEPAGLLHERLGFQQKLFFQRREVHRKRQVLHQDFVMERLLEQGRKGRVLAAPQKVSRHLAQLRQKIRRKFGIGMSALVRRSAGSSASG